MKSIKRRLSLSIRRSRSSFIDESISEHVENDDDSSAAGKFDVFVILMRIKPVGKPSLNHCFCAFRPTGFRAEARSVIFNLLWLSKP